MKLAISMLLAAGLLATGPAWAEDVAPAAAATAVDAPAAASPDKDDDLEIKLSLPTESDRQAWKSTGFRILLGWDYGWLYGLSGAPGGRGNGVVIRFGLRVDQDWSLLMNFAYGSVAAAPVSSGYGTSSTGLAGLRWTGTLDPTWHVTDNLQLAMGFGFAGITEGRSGRQEPNADQLKVLASSYTMTKTYPPVSSCSGTGVAALLRAEYLFVLGPMLTTGATAQVDGQWTACVETAVNIETDTGQPITRRQWWPHYGGSLGWVVGWR